jgi:hypothetical protein
MSIFYCPQCKKFNKDFHYDCHAPQVANIRDGFGRPFYHIKCKCGNYLAGYMNFDLDEEEYIKYVITLYNSMEDNGQWYNYVKENYDRQERRIKDVKRRIFTGENR